MNIRFTFPEDVRSVVASFSNGKEWELLIAEDETDKYKLLFDGESDMIKFKEMRSLYWYLELPFGLHCLFEECFTETEENAEDHTEKEFLEKLSAEKNSYALFIGSRQPTLTIGEPDIGLKLAIVRWAMLVRQIPFGILDIKIHLLSPFFEEANRLPLLLKVIDKVSKVPCLDSQT